MRLLALVSLIFFFLKTQADNTIQYSIYFGSGGIRPSKSVRLIIDSLINFSQAKRIASITLSGYADSTGSAELNLKLSEKRAQAIADSLIKRGMDGKYIKVTFYGKDRPKYPNATKEGRAQNRRVDIEIKQSKDCPHVYYGPNKEELEIDDNTLKGIDCENVEAQFIVAANQKQLEDSKVFTVKSTTGENLWSGGMIRFMFCQGTRRLPCVGNVTLRLPKGVYNMNGMNFYTGEDQNGKIVWQLDSSLVFTDKGGFYEVTVSCDILERGLNCDRKRPCICSDCQSAFLSPNVFLAPGDPGTASTAKGITLKMDASNKNFGIKDIWDEGFLQRNHVHNTISDSNYTYYHHLFSISSNNSSSESIFQHSSTGDARIYLCKNNITPDASTVLYEWIKPDKSKDGFWKKVNTPLQKIMSDAGCTMYWFPVPETGLYMISDTTLNLPLPLVMKMRKKFVLTDGYTIAHNTGANAQAIMLPVSKEGKLFSAVISPEKNTSVISVFKKRNKYFLFNYTTDQINEMAKGKMLKVTRKTLQPLPSGNVDAVLKVISKRMQVPDRRNCL